MTLTNIHTKNLLKGSKLKKDLLDSGDEDIDQRDILGGLDYMEESIFNKRNHRMTPRIRI
jgi:hypothetical protein